MHLIISLSNPDILPDTLRTRRVEFGTDGGVIGRHQDCDWILDDPERFVSSRHLNILFKGDIFFAEDISTNGTYLNEELIGKGNKVPLITGDILRLGRFILAVEQRDDSGAILDETGNTAPPVDLLANTSQGNNMDAFDLGGKEDDLLAAPGETDEIDGFIGDSFTASTDDDLLSGSAPLAGVQDALPVQRQIETSEAVPSDWMNRTPEPSSTPEALEEPSAPSGEVDDYGLTPVPPKNTPVAKIDKNPTTKTKSKKKAAPKKAVKKKAPKKSAKTIEKPVKLSEAVERTKPVETIKPIVEKAAIPVAIASAPVVAAAVSAAPQYSEPLSEDFGTSLAGALLLKPEQATGETGHMLGLVMRELIEGSIDLLETRNQMCQELRLSGTMVGARENNPLKFSINYQDALSRMLQGESMGFKPAVESTTEVVGDLKRHQLGILAGIDAGVKALLDALDPKNMNKGKTGLAGLSLTSKMAEQHAKIKEDTVERSDGLFWRAFAEAYKMAVAQSQT